MMNALREIVSRLYSDAGSSRQKASLHEDLRKETLRIDLTAVPEKSIQALLSQLFSIIKIERNTYLKVNVAAQTAIGYRLGNYGQCVLQLFDSILFHVKFKTTRLFIHHLLDVLPVVRDVLIPPLANLYLRVLQKIMGCPQHLDHFDHDLWQHLATFCINSIECYEGLNFDSNESDSDSRTTFDYAKSKTSRNETISLFSCMTSLAGWHAAQFCSDQIKATGVTISRLLALVRRSLRKYRSDSASLLQVLLLCRTILQHVSTNDISSAIGITSMLMSVAEKCWISKLPSVREELLHGLTTALPFFRLAVEKNKATSEMRSLAQIVANDLLTRPDRLCLQLSDIHLHSPTAKGPCSSNAAPTLTISPEPMLFVSEKHNAFFSIKLLAELYLLIGCAQDSVVRDEPENKRMKLNDASDDAPFLEFLQNGRERDTVLGLQIWIMMIEHDSCPRDPTQDMYLIKALLASESQLVQIWAQVCLGAAIVHGRAIPFFANEQNKRYIWHCALQGIESAAINRSACHLACAMLCHCGLASEFIGPATMTIARDMSARGPFSLCDTSSTFVLTILMFLKDHNYIDSVSPSQMGLSWLQSRLSIDKSGDMTQKFSCAIDFLAAISALPLNMSTSQSSVKHSLLQTSHTINTERHVRSLLLDHYTPAQEEQRWTNEILLLTFQDADNTIIHKILTLLARRARELCHMAHETDHMSTQQFLDAFALVLTYARYAYALSQMTQEHEKDIYALCLALQHNSRDHSAEESFFAELHRALLKPLFFLLSTSWQVAESPSSRGIMGIATSMIDTWCHSRTKSISEQFLSSVDTEFEQRHSAGQDSSRAIFNSTSSDPYTVDGVFLLALMLDIFSHELPSPSNFRIHFLQNVSVKALLCQIMWQVWDKIPKPIADVYTHDIINFLVETVLHEYQLERSESTFLFVVEFLSAIARAWALAPIDDNIVIMARKVFDWLVRIVLTAQLASAMVRQKVVKLCSKLLRYGVDTSSREDPEMTTISLRTILVNELEDYDLRVALTAASVITAIFHTHDTSTYDQIYNDVTEALATVSDQVTRMRLRLFTLAQLAINIEVIRSTALYHILEMMPVSNLRSLIDQIVRHIATRSQLELPELLRTHHKNLLYNWLSHGSVYTFPYHLFGLKKLKHYLELYAEEIIAQAVVLGRSEDVRKVSQELNTEVPNLLNQAAIRISAYQKLVLPSDVQTFSGYKCLPEHDVSVGSVGDQELLVVQFELLHDSIDPARSLAKAGMSDAAQLAGILSGFISDGPRSPAREVLQTTPKMFLTSICKSKVGLTSTTIMRCLRSSLNVLLDGMLVSRWQSLRKIVLILAIAKSSRLSSYAMTMILHGFCLSLDTDQNALQVSIIRLSIYLLQQIQRGDLNDSASELAILLHIVQAAQNMSQGPEKTKLLAELRESARILPDEQLETVLSLLQAGDLTRSDLEHRILLIIQRASESLLTKNSNYAKHFKTILIEVVSQCMMISLWENSKVVSTITHFAGGTTINSSSQSSRLLNYVVGQSLWNVDPIQEDYRDCPDQVFSPDYQHIITEELLHSLSSFNSRQAEVIERTLARCVQSREVELDKPTTSDILQNFRDFHLPYERIPTTDKSGIEICQDYDNWLRRLVIFLLSYLHDRLFLQNLSECLLNDTEFATRTVKYLVLQAIKKSGVEKDDIYCHLEEHLQTVFSEHVNLTPKHIMTCLSICHWLRASGCLRYYSINTGHVVQVTINSLSVAQAAAHHRFMYDAALFLEYHVMQCRTASSSPAIQAVQESIYLTLTEPDSYYGVIVVPSLQAALQRVRYEHGSGKSLPFHAAMQAAERRLSRNKDPDLQQLIDASYCDLGYDSLSLIGGNFVQSTNDAKFESAWRLEEWNLPFTSSPQIQQIMYQTLCKLSTVDWAQSSQTDRILDNAHMHFSVCLDRRSTQTKLILGSFVELSEIVNIRSDHLQEIPKLLKTTWRARSTSLKKILEPDAYEFFIAARQVYSNMARKQIKDDSPLITAQLELLISDYECCSKSQSQQALLNATTFAERLATSPGYSCPFALRVQLDSLVADVLWQYGESSMSISLLSNVIERTKKSHDVAALILSTNLLNIGLRSAHGRLEKPKEILHKYLLSSIEHLCHESSEAAGNIHARFASFCHEQFMSHDQNKDFQRLERLRNEKKQEIMILDSLKDSCNGSEEKRRLLAQRDKARSIFEVDDAEYQQIKSTRSVYLRSSLTSFLKAFTLTESADMLISRCCALWFANSADSIANESFGEVVTKIPSHKFLILLNQFLSRISTTNDMFQTNLTTLLLRLAKDHPYHSLYTMYAVQYSKRSGDQPAKDRARAVARVMQELMTDVSFETIATKVQCICSNYVKLATTIINKKDFPTRDIPFKSVTNYRAFSVQIPSLNLPPLTLTIEPRASCDYSDITSISSYEKTFNIAGGISAPKVLKLRLSDGSICKELVKGGNDDLRQDVVMQQVFVQVDELFKRNRETSKRKLKIRTYKVLPLATNAGVLEWVLDTKPLQDVLQPVHEKYNVDDWSYSDCRRTIAEVSKKSRQTRIEAYRRVKQHCRPSMRHAFLEMFTDAFNWYHAQLAYTRSTAAISIVGHILGLGDRHLHNILLDTKTGEVVHIDLGIAFEQGKTLPIPERVPFRLTRDIVHGMGILGVEGVFRRCCEFTLEMMRTEQTGITSILDVLKHDPLYSWTLSPVRKHRVQERANDGSGVVGSESKVPNLGGEAERALLVVEQKLSSSLSASAAVNELIQEATDEENLALVFAGWSAWY